MSDIKSYVFPEGGGGSNDFLLGSMMNGGGGFGGGMWNNPIWAIVFLAALRNNGIFGNDSNSIQEQLQTIQGNNALMSAIQGGTNEVRSLANTLNADINAVQGAINAVQSAICGVGNQVGMSSAQVVNAVQNGNMQLANAIQSGMCDVRQDITNQGYQNQLQNLNQTNVLQASINAVGTGVDRNFAHMEYTSAEQTCQLKQNNNDNTNRIIAKLDSIEDSRKDREIDALQTQLSNYQQTAQFNSLIGNAVAPINQALASLGKSVAEIESKQPNTVTLPYSNATAVPTAYLWGTPYGMANFANGGGFL